MAEGGYDFENPIYDDDYAEDLEQPIDMQGITIVCILTASGMIIGFIVEAVTGSAPSTPPTPSPTSPNGKSGVKEWIKNNLKILENC